MPMVDTVTVNPMQWWPSTYSMRHGNGRPVHAAAGVRKREATKARDKRADGGGRSPHLEPFLPSVRLGCYFLVTGSYFQGPEK